jgi:hypothetical protein
VRTRSDKALDEGGGLLGVDADQLPHNPERLPGQRFPGLFVPHRLLEQVLNRAEHQLLRKERNKKKGREKVAHSTNTPTMAIHYFYKQMLCKNCYGRTLRTGWLR